MTKSGLIDRVFWIMAKRPKGPPGFADLARVTSVLVMRECCIGDVLMMTPMLANLCRLLPHAEVCFATGDWSRPVLEHNRLIDRLLPLPGYGRTTGRRFRRDHFDLVIAGDVGAAATLTARATGARIRAGFDVAGRGALLTHAVPKDPSDERHERVAYLDVLRALGMEPVDYPLHMDTTPEEQAWAEEYLGRRLGESGLDPERPVVAVFPGGGQNPGTDMPTKRWPAEGFARVADEVIETYDANVLFVGGHQDSDVTDEVGGLMSYRSVNAAGIHSLRETAALIERCHLFIGNDSGPMHIAAALGVRTVSLFGPTPAGRLAPIGPGHRSVSSPSACSPCYLLVLNTFDPCPDPVCMRELLPETVLEAAEAVWGEEPERLDVDSLCPAEEPFRVADELWPAPRPHPRSSRDR